MASTALYVLSSCKFVLISVLSRSTLIFPEAETAEAEVAAGSTGRAATKVSRGVDGAANEAMAKGRGREVGGEEMG